MKNVEKKKNPKQLEKALIRRIKASYTLTKLFAPIRELYPWVLKNGDARFLRGLFKDLHLQRECFDFPENVIEFSIKSKR